MEVVVQRFRFKDRSRQLFSPWEKEVGRGWVWESVSQPSSSYDPETEPERELQREESGRVNIRFLRSFLMVFDTETVRGMSITYHSEVLFTWWQGWGSGPRHRVSEKSPCLHQVFFSLEVTTRVLLTEINFSWHPFKFGFLREFLLTIKTVIC